VAETRPSAAVSRSIRSRRSSFGHSLRGQGFVHAQVRDPGPITSGSVCRMSRTCEQSGRELSALRVSFGGYPADVFAHLRLDGEPVPVTLLVRAPFLAWSPEDLDPAVRPAPLSLGRARGASSGTVDVRTLEPDLPRRQRVRRGASLEDGRALCRPANVQR
jgi:hypothetical protein